MIRKIKTNQLFKKHHIGRHLICDMWNTENMPDDIEAIEKVLRTAAVKGNATVLGSVSHKFKPAGVTVVILLAESHISLHSWPEYKYVAIDVFTCGDNMDPMKSIKYLTDQFKPGKISTKAVKRGQDRGQQ